MITLKVYTKDNCPVCESVKKFLNSKKIKFQEIVIGKDIPRHEIVEKYPLIRFAPIIESNNIVIDTYNLESLVDSGIIT